MKRLEYHNLDSRYIVEISICQFFRGMNKNNTGIKKVSNNWNIVFVTGPKIDGFCNDTQT